jgi:hypothetical protein
MVEELEAGDVLAHVVAGPAHAELQALGRELPDEVGEVAIVGVVAGGGGQHGDNVVGGPVPVAVLAGTAWMSRVSVDTGYLFGIALAMVVFGIGQGFGLCSLMAGVEPPDAAVAGGLVNVAHHLGGALGLGILVTVFDAAGSRTDGPQALLADASRPPSPSPACSLSWRSP